MTFATTTDTTAATETSSAKNATGESSRVARIVRPIATVVMTAGFGFFGVAKILAAEVLAGEPTWTRLTEAQWAAIGVLEVIAVISLVLALSPRFRPLGVAAATGLAALAGCAVVFHITNSDPASDILPAVLQGLVAATYAVVGGRDLRAR